MSEFSSQGKASDNWKSPRRVDEEIKLYQRERFEIHMRRADIGSTTRELAIQAMRDEIDGTVILNHPTPNDMPQKIQDTTFTIPKFWKRSGQE